MKKVNLHLSFGSAKGISKKCALIFAVIVIIFTSFLCAVQLSSDNDVKSSVIAGAKANREPIPVLSESFLSPNIANNISVLDLNNVVKEPSSEDETLDPAAVFVAETTTVKKVEKTTKEITTAEKAETTSKKAETTKAETTTAAQVNTTEAKSEEPTAQVAANQDGYSFAELGIRQMSSMPVPDSVRFDKNGIPLNYRYTLSGKSTTYIGGTITATGARVRPGVVAVNPKIIPYHTKMYIVASDGSGYVYGYASAEDTGGFIYWNNGPLVDLYVNSMSDVYYWANKPVTIYIL